MVKPEPKTRCPDPAELNGLIAGRPRGEAIALERRAVEHLDRPCSRCWGTLRRLAEDAEAFAPWLVAAHWRAVSRPREVPLALVLARAAAGPLAAGAAHQRPVVRYFLAWAGDRPLVITRLVLEECRSLALRHGDGLERMRAAAPWLETSPAAKCHPERFRDLGHLMTLFLISEHDAEKGGPGVGERLLRLRSKIEHGRDGSRRPFRRFDGRGIERRRPGSRLRTAVANAVSHQLHHPVARPLAARPLRLQEAARARRRNAGGVRGGGDHLGRGGAGPAPPWIN